MTKTTREAIIENVQPFKRGVVFLPPNNRDYLLNRLGACFIWFSAVSFLPPNNRDYLLNITLLDPCAIMIWITRSDRGRVIHIFWLRNTQKTIP